MKAHVLDLKGNKASEMTLKEEVFGVVPNLEVMAQYLHVHASNKRQGTVKTKTRGDVSGSGAKPWNQKGTGRARVGEKRNPIWRHGGISHGPQPKEWNLELNKKVRQLALVSALSDKVNTGSFIIVEDLKDLKGKTKEAVQIIKALALNGASLVLAKELTTGITRSLRNIKDLDMTTTDFVNAWQVIRANKVIATKEAVLTLEKKLARKANGALSRHPATE
jgi:large subunit ribosomal protein L4